MRDMANMYCNDNVEIQILTLSFVLDALKAVIKDHVKILPENGGCVINISDSKCI